MNATAEPVLVPLANPVADFAAAGLSAAGDAAREPCPVADFTAREGVLEVPGELILHHGGRLSGVRLAWRMVGPANAPVICALGGISASRRVCLSDEPRHGWWSEVAGPDRPLDTHRYRILSFDYLGGSGETTGPRDSQPFPSISTYDQAELLLRLLNHLGIKALRAIAGGSYGGMVALAFGERYPERAGRLVVLCAADRPHPLATAWRSVQRQIVRLSLESGRAADGLKLARALAMSTYRSSEELEARFAGPPALESDRFVFPVERYLMSRGADYVARHRPESFLCLSESIDLHRVDANRIFTPTIAIGVREDQLVPLADVRGMVARLGSGRFHEISSLYGHDAFLKESQQLRGVFAAALESN
jgi:homoserine O-acetyltransferase/O-succinyltransferase